MSGGVSAANGAERLRVLVADDDPDILGLVSLHLERAGYEVVRASDGAQAIERARTTSPDLLVLDVSMPVVDGYTVCREVQAFGPTPPSVIFLTAHGHTSARVAGLDSGAVDYIGKPFKPAELTARVRAALRTRELIDSLAADAATDPLTGLFNRRRLDEQAAELMALARRHERSLACVMLDVDRFKQVNDTLGHSAGDEVLRRVADELRAATRISDVVGRYAGDEFLALLPETTKQGASAVGERIRTALRHARLGATLSIGVATWEAAMTDFTDLYDAADRALYEAKRLGRDRVEASPCVPLAS